MYFKRLEITGFKSFVDYTSLDFEAGISAIVGPNGCGKSNVVDALRWVLGEQSAKALRGARMEDVIFNGTDTRKALGMAEVSLTINNQDHQLPTEHDEITLTRRTYRSGESEYLLNKVTCRLRDIHDLIIGTGIGTNAYSFLEQGKIDLIVSSKPMDRRFVFEEAAGVSRYRARKEESLRKLEATDQNYLRMNDISVEVKRQIGTLERQAQKARRYQELKQELTTLEVSRGRKELRERRQAVRKLEHVWKEQWSQLQELEKQKNAAEAESLSMGQGDGELDQTLAQTQETLHRVLEDIIKAEEFISASGLRTQDLQIGIERNEQELTDLTAKEVLLKQNQAGILESRQAKAGELQQLQGHLEESEEQLERLENEMKERAVRVQERQNHLLQLVDQMSALRGSLENLEQRRAEQQQRLEQLNQKLEAFAAQRTGITDEKQRLDADADAILEATVALDNEKAALQSEKEGLETTLGVLQTMLDNFNKTATQLTSRLHWIQELKNGLDGYESGAKSILLEHNAHPERFPGVIGPVANFLRTEQKLELAFESLLGHRLQYILVQTVAQAKEAIDYLAGDNRGRATFVPCECYADSALAAAPTAPGDQVWLSLPGTVGRACDLVKIDERFRTVFNRLLEDAVIVRDWEASEQARQAGARCTLVTLNGEVDSGDRCLTGGSTDISERGFLGREREIEELNSEFEVLQNNLAASQGEAEKVKNRLEEINSGLQANSAGLHELQIRTAKLDKSIETITGQSAEVEKQFAAMTGERDAVLAMLEKTVRDHADAFDKLAGLEQLDQQTQEELSSHQDQIEARRQDYDEYTQRAGQLRISAAATGQQLSSLDAEALRLQSETKEVLAHIQGKQTAMATDRARVEELETQCRQKRDALAQLDEEKNQHQELLAVQQRRRQELQEQKNLRAQESRRLQQAVDAARQAQHLTEMEKKQTEYNLKSLEEYLQTEYKLNLAMEDEPLAVAETAAAPEGEVTAAPEGETAAAPEETKVLDEAAAAARIQEIKEKLSSMGSVNLVAMDEYNELLQRFEFLTKQLTDLKESKESLQRLITKINQESRSRFYETFTQVKERFREVFRGLFNGGDAELVLVDENNLLETGIEIIARPPGKRLQNISLLSGGEKALTAIALLFAIFLIKPSPFCIFDEMDAPLDDNNTFRFGKILKEFAKNSQFIVITHNKITMETADVLYGVTMQEPGVSSLISARFKNETKEHPIQPMVKPAAESVVMN